MGNAPSAPAPSPSTPRTSKSQPRSLPTSPAKSSSPSPTPVSAPVKPKELEPVLRPNRKSIELPGLNSFGPTPPPTSSRMRVSSRIVDRGRTWLHREGRSTNGSNPNGSFTANANGRGRGPQTKSAAIAIPSGRRPGWDDDDERETGYGRHVQEGIARRKAEKAKEAEEQQRRRGRSRSRHDDDHLRAPSPSRSTSHSNSPSHSRSRSPSRSQSRGGDSADPRHRAPYPSPDDRVYEMRERNRAALEAAAERARAQERLFGADTAHSSTAYQEEVIFSTIPLTIGPATFVGAAEGDGDLDDEDGEGDGARSRAVAAMVDEIIGPNPPPPQLTAVDIAWRGQGTSVALIRAGDKDWQNPTELDKA
ncbi:hypothetical protein C8F01DRAFT_514347 [Mycena amicta]|nr:hypothetical protein C8F01DRAFT_514347 [Mycena amicta]